MNLERIEARIKRYQRANFLLLLLLVGMIIGVLAGNSMLIVGCALIGNMIKVDLLSLDNRDLENEISELKENRCIPKAK